MCVHECISLLVDTTCHVFNVFGFVLQATVIVVSLHTCLYFTPDGRAQLSAKRAFLEKMAKNTKLFIFHFNETFKAGVRETISPSVFLSWFLVWLSSRQSFQIQPETSWSAAPSPRKKARRDDRTARRLASRLICCTRCRRRQRSYHTLVMRGHFFGVVSVKHAPSFILFLAGMTKATALATVPGASSNRGPVSLEKTEQKEAAYSKPVQIQ